ncbi:hypothetical protein SEA_DELAGARZA_4 [Microbacterium phage DelaGarza]|nr:hypothetical protein SEA_DELAGARZA_4 [Microbacterium phage DelaGarza]
METEQMAEVYGRQPMGSMRPGKRTGVEMTHEAKVETPHPIPARTLAALVESVPSDAEFVVTPKMGGSQRDPEVVGYRIVARWSTR